MTRIEQAVTTTEVAYYKLLSAKHRLHEDDDTSPVLAQIDGVLSHLSAVVRLLRNPDKTALSSQQRTKQEIT